MRARRLQAAAALAVVGVFVLGGCARANPSVAAYVGDTKITRAQVDDVYDDLRAGLEAAAAAQQGATPSPGTVRVPVSKEDILSAMVFTRVCQRLPLAANGPQITAAQVGQALSISPDARYAKLRADLETCKAGIQPGQLKAPTPAEMREVYDRGRALGVIPAEVSFEQAAAQLDGQQLRTGLAARRVLSEAADKMHISVNPRYRPLEYPVLEFQQGPALTVPLGEPASGVVVGQS
jgi:hypothetical protein